MRKIRERSLRLESLEDRMLLAVTAGGEEVAAAAIYAAPLPTEATQLATPTGFRAASSANSSVDLSWDAVANASGYTVYWQTTAATAWRSATTTSNSHTVRGLVKTTLYNFKVVANGDGVNYTDSEESVILQQYPDPSQPPVYYSTEVTTLSDTPEADKITFRQAVAFASQTGDTVTFADGLSGTIDLAIGGQIKLAGTSKSFTIEGDNRITLTNTGTSGTDRIFVIRDVDDDHLNITLNNLTITGCSATNDTTSDPNHTLNDGGAIFVWNLAFDPDRMNTVNFILNNCTFTNNTAVSRGGAVSGYGLTVTATDCTFSGNSAKEGGAIRLQGGDVFLTDSEFTGNAAVGTTSAEGGAFALSTLYGSTIENCTITGNKAMISSKAYGSDDSAQGGAFYLNGVTCGDSGTALTIRDCEISGNTATCLPEQTYCNMAQGGAFYMQNAGARFYNCSITGNSAVLGLTNEGGAVCTEGTWGNVSSQQTFFFMTDISGNYVGYKDNDIWAGGGAGNCPSVGGAIYAKAVFHVVNSTICDNTIYATKAANQNAQMAGSAMYFDSNALIYDSTISGNRVVGDGSADQCNFAAHPDTAALCVFGAVQLRTTTIMGNYTEDTSTGAKTDNDIYSHAWRNGSPDMLLLSCAYNPDGIVKEPVADWMSEEQKALCEGWNFDCSSSCIQVTDYEAYFNDYAAGDYTLAADSAGIDAVNMSEWTNFGYDYDIRGEGYYRVVNEIVDIGAYEFQTAAPTFEVTIEDYTGVYDGAEHSITVSDLEAGDVVYYSEDGESYSTDEIAYTDPGAYTIYVKVERAGYEDFLGSGTVTITEAMTKLNVAVVVSSSAATATELEVLPDSITTATVGDTLYAQVWILNADNSASGCTGGYIDLSYTAAALDGGSYTVSSIYSSQADRYNDSVDGLVSCFGGCSQAGVNNLAVSKWALLGTYTVVASAEGNAEVAAGLPTLNGTHIKGLNLARAGEGNFADAELGFGSVAFTVEAGGGEQLAAPVITTGNRGIYVSYGANRHYIQWGAVANASGYEVQYTTDGSTWLDAAADGTAAEIHGLTYGADVTYRVRALGTGSYTDSDWSRTKTFNVCPMDINNDGDIGGLDRNILAVSWGTEEGDDEYQYYADINADGDIGGLDRNFLGSNWGAEAGDEDLTYPRPVRADAVFAAYEAGDLDVDFDVF